MKKALAVVMDPIAQVHYQKDSTLALLCEAQRRNYELFYITSNNLYSLEGKAYANAQVLTVFADEQQWYSVAESQDIELSKIDVILMRQDPPFNMNYVVNTYILELAEKHGALVVNKPQALRDANAKFFINEFPQYAPPTLVSADAAKLKYFLQQKKDYLFSAHSAPHQWLILKECISGRGEVLYFGTYCMEKRHRDDRTKYV